MTEREIIRSARERVGIRSDRALAECTGLSYSTLMHERRTDPGSFILRELRQIIKKTDMQDADILALIKGGGR